jgi:urease accessory protein
MTTNQGTLPSLTGPVSTNLVATLSLTLPFDARKRSRQRVLLSDGSEAALSLARGTVLRGGDLLELEGGKLVLVKAADETVSTVFADSALMLTKVAYHLGNRHVPLQVCEEWLRYQHDHVLDDMVRGLGARVVAQIDAFEPEGGAHGGGHGHSHDHEPAGTHHHHEHGEHHHHGGHHH